MIYFVNIKDLTCNFCSVYCFFFLNQFLSDLDEKKYQNLAKIKGYKTTYPNQFELVLGPWSFSVLV